MEQEGCLSGHGGDVNAKALFEGMHGTQWSESVRVFCMSYQKRYAVVSEGIRKELDV